MLISIKEMKWKINNPRLRHKDIFDSINISKQQFKHSYFSSIDPRITAKADVRKLSQLCVPQMSSQEYLQHIPVGCRMSSIAMIREIVNQVIASPCSLTDR